MSSQLFKVCSSVLESEANASKYNNIPKTVAEGEAAIDSVASKATEQFQS